MTAKEEVKKGLTPYISPAAAWAFAVGTSVGWGSLVITCTTYLAQAGPAGTALGLITGGLIMLLVSRNYHYMMNPELSLHDELLSECRRGIRIHQRGLRP